ncbi:MAG: nitrite/sulfite reductase [Gammaproteobacteria bacterium]|uniref:Sulfite reductase (NADPH) hemoprotein beta-component n=1 Tax=Marinomonas polaris DSM 16579 TaxID=1122206 RepID=A0A1M5LM99_9GAMM|nr:MULTISPECIES: nitrite/sulfite reductase [Marinomonas]MBU1297435.1 nitrite/sulfite reductase [Gammaproteobacteria bacterium]MBU1467811.1 nitrite/sulfite reductase [Gammaproteobacteria bacterium]MBU2023080.1 nitrite/sulfite reductase [Gammaproteobacteria bacterium]MBU2238695.1 nitrite/sulfite reductase [Gammaproteobacteria bacterium]MBU2317493.1 nitrite/sulfite reductase [Gammaproteobacteria bacterium]|tara:strand:- start:4377 stop:6038 length:1662 start_codon:yes stop_codon:yes gene_type:complete
MYQYDAIDQQLVEERVAQFRDQTRRYLNQELSEQEFLPLRLQNGLYVQRYAPMLRIAIPYGMLSSAQLRKLADISCRYDRSYGHFSTRQNLQLNWPKIEDVPDILAELAEVQMHATQTSGNCIRNTTTDQYAGVISDEVVDPRPYCELIRQWSTFHPEFAFLPRKFKIAVNATESADRAAVQVHDIGLQIRKNDAGEIGFKVMVGGGLGRTPMVGVTISEFIPRVDLLTYLDAIIRVYNQQGRRDNKYKARIKILVKALGIEEFRSRVEAEWQHLRGKESTVPMSEFERLQGFFSEPNYETLENNPASLTNKLADSAGFARWFERNTFEHKKAGYRIVTLTLKKAGQAPGDATAEQMQKAANLADQFSFSELRVSHEQNLVLADVRQDQLVELWEAAKEAGFATPTLGLLTDMICCPGGDFCALANAKSIPIAAQIQETFNDLDYLYDLGNIDLNISGCMNACGHHHVGNIGILGVDKKGEEFYQISIGGASGHDASIGKILGPSFAQEEISSVIQKLMNVYVENRSEEERFIDTYRRVGITPFKEAAYAKAN